MCLPFLIDNEFSHMFCYLTTGIPSLSLTCSYMVTNGMSAMKCTEDDLLTRYYWNIVITPCFSGTPMNSLQRINRIKIFCNVSPNEFYSALLVLLVLVSLFKDKHVQESFYTHRKGYFFSSKLLTILEIKSCSLFII